MQEVKDTKESSGGARDNVDEAFASALNFDDVISADNWRSPGEYYQSMPATTRAVVAGVVETDKKLRRELREEYLPMMRRDGTVLAWESAKPRYIELLQQKKLYPGHVVAADGTLSKYETLSLVGAQIAISKVSYQGNSGQFVSNIMHWGKELPREVRPRDILESLRSRGTELTDKLPNAFLYALMLYKERQVLLDTGSDTFKLIQGTVFPYELLIGSGAKHTMLTCLTLLGQLIEDGNYATIVSNASQRELLALGMALDAGEYLVVDTGTNILAKFRETANYVSTPQPSYGGKSQIQLFEEFQLKYGPKVVQGVLRAHPLSPPYIFYCNQERLGEAVHILLADAANMGARGFPLLIDLADQYCAGAFRASEYVNHMNAEFSRAAGGSGMYQAERQTRD